MKDYLGYKGKVCIVTGAANGMGRAAAEELVDLGAEVYGLDFAEVAIPGVKYVQINLGDRKSIDAAFTQIPEKVDCYFGIAGVSGMKHSFVETVEINYLSNKYIIEEYLVERMVPGSAIGIITSMTSYRWKELLPEYQELVQAETWDEAVESIKDWPIKFDTTKYSISKLASNYYNVHMVKPLGEKGIRINTLLAGSTSTQLRSEFDAGIKQASGNVNRHQKGVGGRLAEPSEMADPLIFLNSNMASFISGQQLCVDNGSAGMIEAGDAPDNLGKSKLVAEFKRLNRDPINQTNY